MKAYHRIQNSKPARRDERPTAPALRIVSLLLCLCMAVGALTDVVALNAIESGEVTEVKYVTKWWFANIEDSHYGWAQDGKDIIEIDISLTNAPQNIQEKGGEAIAEYLNADGNKFNTIQIYHDVKKGESGSAGNQSFTIEWKFAGVEGTKYTFTSTVRDKNGNVVKLTSDFRSGTFSASRDPDKYKTENENYIVEPTLILIGLMPKEELLKHLVSPLEPAALRVNMFDYYSTNVAGSYAYEGDPWTQIWKDKNENVLELNPDIYNGGINANHHLKFYRDSLDTADLPSSTDPNPENGTRVGQWNYNSINMHPNITDLVKKVLGMDGYPQLNLNDPKFEGRADDSNLYYADATSAPDDESLAYLFDPSVVHDGKSSYSGVTGLFQMDSDGYYYYDSKRNFAELDTATNKINLYNSWAVYPAGGSPNGQFFPFNSASEVFSGVDSTGKLVSKTKAQFDSRMGVINHWLGMTMSVDFMQPKNGEISRGSNTAVPMTFEFAGDDDVWIFVDGVLVLDLGGTHSGLYGKIDFSTGETVIGLMDKDAQKAALDKNNIKFKPVTSTLREKFVEAEAEDTVQWNGNTFADYTNHTIQVFFMERGHWDSNLAIYFNLQPSLDQKIYKVDEDGNGLGDAEFELYAAEPITEEGNPNAYNEEHNQHEAREFQQVGEKLGVVKTSDGTGSDSSNPSEL